MNNAYSSDILTRLASARILFVDDSEMMLEILYTCLKTWNVPNAVSAETSTQCLDELERHSFDALIVDWRLRGEDGLDLVRKIRRELPDPVRRTPVVLCTGYTEHRRVMMARDAGINEVLCKPFVPKQLFLKLGSAMLDGRKFIVTEDYVGPEPRHVQGAVIQNRSTNLSARTGLTPASQSASSRERQT